MTAQAQATRLVTPAPDEEVLAGRRHAGYAGLTVLGRAELEQRRLRRRARMLRAAAALVVAAALIVVAAGQAIVAAQQVHLDRLDRSLATAVARNENLQLTRAQLASPTRILTLAERELGMVVPKHVTYLVPVDPYRSGAPTESRTGT